MATLQRTEAIEVGWSEYKRPGILRRLGRIARQQPAGVFGLIVLSLFVFLGIFGPYVTPYDPRDPKAVAEYWKSAVRHTGLAELKRKRGERGPQKAPDIVPVTTL